jgi:hypothetical protein
VTISAPGMTTLQPIASWGVLLEDLSVPFCLSRNHFYLYPLLAQSRYASFRSAGVSNQTPYALYWSYAHRSYFAKLGVISKHSNFLR